MMSLLALPSKALGFAFLSGINIACAEETISVSVKWDSSPVNAVDSRELSFAWDIYALDPTKYPGQLDLTSVQLQKLTKQLGPMVFRISGTGVSDAQIESVTGEDVYVPIPPDVKAILRHQGDPYNATQTQISELMNFALGSGSDVMLGLNQLTRDWPDGHICTGDANNSCPWVGTNARAWMEYNRDQHLSIYGYELGNEPGCYMDDAGEYSTGITAADAAADYRSLKAIIDDVYKDSDGDKPIVLGPATGGCKHADQNAKILAEDLAVDVVTFHHYVLGGAVGHDDPNNVNTSSMIDYALSNTTHDLIASYLPAWKENASEAALWLGEGGTTCQNRAVQESYAMLFNSFNILREGGLAGVSLFIKQSLHQMFRVCTADEDCDYQVQAYYWFAYFWKREMNGSNNEGSTESEVYEAQTSSETILAVARGKTVAILNLGNKDVILAIQEWASKTCNMYSLSPTEKGPDGNDALVNGLYLEATKDGSIPVVAAVVTACGAVSVPQYGIVFVSLA